MSRTPVLSLALSLVFGVCGFAMADAADLLAPRFGVVSGSARLRYEHVDQSNLTRNADAKTVRLALGYRTPERGGLSGFVEGEVVESLGGARYNSSTNRRTIYPVVADPDTVELNQANLRLTAIPDSVIVAGRQAINLANQRFVGAVGFRQNQQTFDALRISTTAVPLATLDGFYATEVHRIFGMRSSAGSFNTNLFSFQATANPAWAEVSAYAHVFDIDDLSAQSSRTLGARATAKRSLGHDWIGSLTLEAATQSDHGNNTSDYRAGYYVFEPGIAKGAFNARLKTEIIEGRGGSSFQFHFGTNHAFQGWADLFLTTPAGGIREHALITTYRLPFGGIWQGTTAYAAGHLFYSDSGDRYGQELDPRLSRQVVRGTTLSLELADYKADGFGNDTQKWWITLAVSF